MMAESPRDLTYAVNDLLRLGLIPRPWDLHRPADTLWWLVPSTDWPAYRHGKFSFSLAHSGPRKALLGVNDSLIHVDRIFAGVNIEKGYGQVAIEVNPALRRRPAQLIDKQWLWFALIQDDGPLRFGNVLGALSASEPVHMYVLSSYVHDRESDVHAERDAVMFACRPAGIVGVLHNGFPVGQLREIERVTDFVTLAERLRAVDDYHWIDLYAGTYVPLGEVNVKQLYRRVLSHFEQWVVEAPAEATRPRVG